jgi:hypothetical protein
MPREYYALLGEGQTTEMHFWSSHRLGSRANVEDFRKEEWRRFRQRHAFYTIFRA